MTQYLAEARISYNQLLVKRLKSASLAPRQGVPYVFCREIMAPKKS